MAAIYKQFLASPSASLLADDASLHYVTTTTSFSGAEEIMKHVGTVQKQVKKKEDVIYVIDGQGVLAVEVDTNIHFQTSGAVYLPGIDDNFLADEKAQLPIMHIVTFNSQCKISQIRQQWDQGSLLKQLNLIGKSGRNWPIRDSKDQLSMIQTCLNTSGHASGSAKGKNEAPIKASTAVLNAMRDPYASLQLFSSMEEKAAELPQIVSPYAGQRPKQRSPHDILTDTPQHDDNDAYLRSPAKSGLKEVQPIRIFEGQEYIESDEDEKPKEKPTHIRAHPTRYQHFNFDDGSDSKGAPKPSTPAKTPRSQHVSQWSFEDFTTPVKSVPVRGMRRQDIHGWQAEEAATAATAAAAADAKQKSPSTSGTLQKSDVLGGVEETGLAGGALGDITNLKSPGMDSELPLSLKDLSLKDEEAAALKPEVKNATSARNKTMDASWVFSEESPIPRKENCHGKVQQDSRIHIAGDGMGGKQGTARDFLYGGGIDEPHRPSVARKSNQATSHASFWE